MSSERRAVIVGAGIAGLTCALALARRSWRVTVLERAAELGEVGAGISLWPRAMAILDDLGVTQRMDGAYAFSVQAGLRRPDGRMLIDVQGGTGRGPVMVHRARLHAALTGGLDGVEVLTSAAVVSVQDAPDEARVVTSDGRVLTGDLVIGADGLRSLTREVLHGSGGPVRYAGYTAYRGVAPQSEATGGETWGRGARFGYVPLPGGRTYWYATANRPPSTAARDERADARRLVEGWHDPIPGLVEATPAGAVLRNDVYDLPLPLRPFHRGRIVLVGDAAHAMTPNLGQGACAGIEDAAALAAVLDEHPRLPDALAAYDRLRRPVTARLIRQSRLVGRLGQLEQPLLLGGRDAMLRLGGVVARLVMSRRAA